jgi:hypothetical protein
VPPKVVLYLISYHSEDGNANVPYKIFAGNSHGRKPHVRLKSRQ